MIHLAQNDGHHRWCRQGLLKRGGKCPCHAVTDDMPFIRADWLIRQNLSDLPRMQDLPADAFLPPPEMDYCYFISHRWLQADHPDVTGRQLALALPEVWIDPLHRDGAHEHIDQKKTGIWYDYLCMPQHPRDLSDETRFRSLLHQHSGLTLCAIPVLVVDKDVEYASRAWCVAELLGVHRSGFSGKSVSLAMHTLKYPDAVCRGGSVWNSDIDVDDGFRLGLEKLQSWLSDCGISLEESSAETKRDWEQHKNCMHAATNVYWDFCIARHKEYDFDDDRLLSTIASRNGLECTREEDVMTCMRIMVTILRAFS